MVVRDDIAHCASALIRIATGTAHGFSPAEALGAPDAYASAGVEDALAILQTGEKGSVPTTDVTLSDAGLLGRIPTTLRLGDPNAEVVGRLHTDTAGLFRIIAGRRPERVTHTIEGITVEDLRMFS